MMTPLHTLSLRPLVRLALVVLQGFYPAEDSHQDYAFLHPTQPYIVYNDLPKIKHLKGMFADRYRDKPVLVRAQKAS